MTNNTSMLYTGYCDQYGTPLHTLAFVTAPSKRLYSIGTDPLFVYCLIDVKNESIEKLTADVARQLQVI